MALDNAQFISELSIVDPPGTDPLSQGDDQIRTIKRATQQSFPLIAAAVNITDVQMNLMAIKNENNTFTVSQFLEDASLFLNDTLGDNLSSINWRKGSISLWSEIQDLNANTNNLFLQRRDVLGAAVDRPWEVDFNTGIVDFASIPTVGGTPVLIAGEIRMLVVGSTIPVGSNWFTADGTNGTVDLRERFIGAIGTTFTGGNQGAFLAAKTDAGSNTGSTAITEAQMPSHAHDPWVSNDQSGGVTDIGLNALTVWGFGGRRNDATRHYDNRRSGGLLINPAGSGQGHTHTTPTAVVENGVDRQTVRPLSRVVQMFQYVP